MTNLYDIAKDYRQLMQLEDVPAEAIADTMESIEGEFQDKAANLIKVTLNIGGEIDQISNEIDRLEKMRLVRQNAINRLRDYLKTNMDATGINKIEHPLFSITLSKPSKKVKIVDEAELPDDYVAVKTSVAPDKAKILKALKDGEAVPGAELEDSERRLIIK